MNVDHAKIIAICIVITIPSVYFWWFGIHLDLSFSPEQEIWGQMGDFFGGVMNPLLTFLTVVLLIQSINHQNHANSSLNSQIAVMEKSEKIKIFENLFFHLVLSQQSLYSKFKVSIIQDGKKIDIFTIQAVDKIESLFQDKKIHETYFELKTFYNQIDKEYGVFDILRAFSVIISLIKDQLSDENGFSAKDRLFYYEKLINLTEFAHLRLICTALQFQSQTGAGIKVQDAEFLQVCKKLNLRINNFYKL